MDIWQPLLKDKKFLEQINEKGFSKEIKFIDYVKENDLTDLLKSTSSVTAQNLSIDFYSKQDSELRKKSLFLIRTGKGKFIVFNEKFFDKSYLELDNKNFEEMEINVPNGFEHLVKAYFSDGAENTSIELLHFLGVFKKITRGEDYFIGPRGCKHSRFDVYFVDKNNETKKIFTYRGQEELDYSLFTKDEIFVFEAKQLNKNGFDIGWHKIIYPVSRFVGLNKKIVPCYILRHNNFVYIYVFNEPTLQNNSIVLNNKKDFIPIKKFKIDLNKIKNRRLS
jgi:hypothetical protein